MQNVHDTSSSAPIPNFEIFDEYVLERIEFQAKRLAVRFRLSDDRRDDIAQEMAVELLKAAKRFDPVHTASWHTYACRVLDLAVKKIIQEKYRTRQREASSIQNTATMADGASSDVQNVIDEGTDDLEQLELRMDIEIVLAQMPARLQKTCRLLMTLSPSEVADEMGIHRSSIYRLIAQARQYFTNPRMGFSDSSATDPAQMRM